MKYYSVHKGHTPGIFTNWSECENSIKGFSNAIYKKFNNEYDAKYFYKHGKIDKISVIDLLNQLENKDDNIEYDNIQYDKYNVYTDGAYVKYNNQDFAGYGIYYNNIDIAEPLPLNEKTNNIAELYAIYQAIKIIIDENTNNKKEIIIHTDSQYAISVLSDNCTKPKKNIELISQIKNILSNPEIKVIFKHIKAHTNYNDEDSIGNNYADINANKGCMIDIINNIDINSLKIPFGKYKDELFIYIPKNYLKWLYKKLEDEKQHYTFTYMILPYFLNKY